MPSNNKRTNMSALTMPDQERHACGRLRGCPLSPLSAFPAFTSLSPRRRESGKCGAKDEVVFPPPPPPTTVHQLREHVNVSVLPNVATLMRHERHAGVEGGAGATAGGAAMPCVLQDLRKGRTSPGRPNSSVDVISCTHAIIETRAYPYVRPTLVALGYIV